MEMLKPQEWLDCLRVHAWKEDMPDEIVLNLHLYERDGRRYYSVRAGLINRTPSPCLVFYEGVSKNLANDLFNALARCTYDCMALFVTNGDDIKLTTYIVDLPKKD